MTCLRSCFGLLLLTVSAAPVTGQTGPSLASRVDSIATQVLQSSGVPSATVAVVKNGQLAYAKAYGCAKLHPCVAAIADHRYAIGSISKQFTAVAALLFQQNCRLLPRDWSERRRFD